MGVFFLEEKAVNFCHLFKVNQPIKTLYVAFQDTFQTKKTEEMEAIDLQLFME